MWIITFLICVDIKRKYVIHAVCLNYFDLSQESVVVNSRVFSSTRPVSGDAARGIVVHNKRFMGPVVRSNSLVVRGDHCKKKLHSAVTLAL